MPKAKLCEALKKEKLTDRNLIWAMKKYRDLAGITNWDDAAPLCGMNKSTFRKRRKAPNTFRRGELHRIMKGLHIPDEEIRPYL